MKLIKTTKNSSVIVDDEDFERVNQFKWSYHKSSAYRHEYGRGYHTPKSTILLHRFIMNAPKGSYVDHVDGNVLNNQKSNLRICTNAQNSANQRIRKNNTSGYKGVCWHKQCSRWMAHISPNRTFKNLGLFKTREEAAKAYNDAAIKYFGEYAKLNEIPNA